MGNKQFVEIIRNHQKMIFKICNVYCQDPVLRKDLEQEVLIQIWQSLKKFDGRVKLSTWIYKVVLNTAIAFYRNDNKSKTGKVDLDVSVISLPDFDDDSLHNEKMRLLYRFIGELNEIDKALILLYLDGNRYKNIAEILGISESNVATKINRIKTSLKKKVSKQKELSWN
ncbi:RNA polymerase sigma factor [Marinifilum caeruleilacunae]|uniref:Sigma-70 family RNA polymerase sigma factor n=1 Tax=Marinifilum caeruleilacunae TaxID=2499076 RepID=A0ABX1WW08_9BACT|nr:sigma-70 family RNA polymerase sigma factor [Marinifilum caeruleilacunae]NOU60313.1 sigma-70 family RNA polymerase sigma factor [Marinifilum caeruleilacunae]